MTGLIAIVKGLLSAQKTVSALKWFFGLRTMLDKLPGNPDWRMLVILILMGVMYYQNTSTIPNLELEVQAVKIQAAQDKVDILESLNK
jgi:hypothetical protein